MLLESIFNDVLAREKQTIYTLNNEPIEVFFRKNYDKNSSSQNLTIFYKFLSPLRAGEQVKIDNKTFLLINQESPENKIYQKSDVVLCDTSCIIPLNNDAIFFDAVLNSSDKIGLSQTSQGNFFVGSMEFLTSPAQKFETMSKVSTNRLITPNDVYEILGKFENNGILHITVKQVNETCLYETKIIGNDILIIGETLQFILQKTATYDSKSYPIKTFDAVFFSDNPAVLEITSEGNAMAISKGIAIVTATFQGNIYNLTVSVQDVPKEVYFSPTELDERGCFVTEFEKTYIFSMALHEANGEKIDVPAEFKVIENSVGVSPSEYDLTSAGTNTAEFIRTMWWDNFSIYLKIQGTIIYENTKYTHVWEIRAKEAWLN